MGSVSGLIDAVRNGDATALDSLLGMYRSYLRVLARTSLDRTIQVKADPSDAAQETLMKAYQNFGEFRGSSEGELINWLKRILANHLRDLYRRYLGEGRNIDREQRLDEAVNESSMLLGDLIPAKGTSPSGHAAQREMSVVVADALDRVQEDHREVLILRSLEEREWEEIAARMNRSEGAVRLLWIRALQKLGRTLETRWNNP